MQEIQVGAAAAAVERDHGGLESVVLHPRVGVIQQGLLVGQVGFAGVDLGERTAGTENTLLSFVHLKAETISL